METLLLPKILANDKGGGRFCKTPRAVVLRGCPPPLIFSKKKKKKKKEERNNKKRPTTHIATGGGEAFSTPGSFGYLRHGGAIEL